MKTFAITCLALLLSISCTKSETLPETETPPAVTPEEPAEPSNPAGDQKIFIVYFSHTGNTRQIAEYIFDAVKSDSVEINTATPYTDDYDTLLAQVRGEVASEFCPPLNALNRDIASYDVIFIGYPIWVETAAPPVRSFLTSNDLSGKTVVPFCTSGTSSAESSYRLIRGLCPQSTVLEGLQIRRGAYDTAKERTLEWLEKIKIIETSDAS